MKVDDSIPQFLLGVTRDAIERCVVIEGGDAAAYDYEVDAKGYAACFLAALHHWCHFHGLDWEVELSWGEEFFKDDLWQTEGKSMLPARPVVKEVSCPYCGQSEILEGSQTEQVFSRAIQTASN